jgi:type II secretory pathway pseudopilin PulG
MLVAVIFLLALLTIAMAVALPKTIKEIQRDREVETMQRGKQYIRAIKMYYKKFGAYPSSIDALAKGTNNVHYLRKKYTDPITGKDDWRLVRVGQNKAPLSMGFFGQPLGGAGADCGTNPTGTASTSSTGLSSGGSTSSFSSSFSSSSSNSTTGSLNTNCIGTNLAPSGDSSTAASGSTPTDPNAPNSGTAANGAANTSTGLSGQTLGGGPVIGVSPNSPKQSIMIYKTKTHYNEWEFVYDPRAEQMMQQGGSSSFGGSTNGNNPGGTTPTPQSPVQQ